MKLVKLSAIIMTLGCLMSGQSFAQTTVAEKNGTVPAAKSGAKLSSESEVGELLDTRLRKPC